MVVVAAQVVRDKKTGVEYALKSIAKEGMPAHDLAMVRGSTAPPMSSVSNNVSRALFWGDQDCMQRLLKLV